MSKNVYLLILGSSFVLSLWIGYNAWTNRRTAGARTLVVMAMATGVWTGGTIGLTLSTAPSAELRWLQASYVGIVAAPIGFVLLSFEYTGNERSLTAWIVGGLLALGGGFLGLVWTNPFHELYWAAVDYAAAVPAGVSTTPAVGFWLFVAFSYLLLLVGTVQFVRYAVTAPHLYRNQSVAILVGVVAPWAANVPHALQFMAADYTPAALSVTTVALWSAMFRYRLTDLGPIALRTVFERVPTGVYVLDRRDRVVEINDAGRELFDVTDDAIGSRFRELAPSEAFYEEFRDVETFRGVVTIDSATGLDDGRKRPDDGTRVPGDGTTRSPDGTTTASDGTDGIGYYDVQVAPIETARGPIRGRLFVVNDVTEQQRQRRQLESQNERLEEFASVVSHDLRNPLNVVEGSLDMMASSDDADHVERGRRATRRMEELIDDMLALAQDGSETTDLETVDLPTVVSDAWSTVDTERATLENEADGGIVADRSRLRQLVENLLRNAVEHGGKTVTVTVGTREGGFYVADDGPGIPAGDRESVFETGHSGSEDGTGFGLGIVTDIADAHGWDVRVTESGDGGARFEIGGVAVAE